MLDIVKNKIKEINLKNEEAKKYKSQITKHVDYISDLVLDIQRQKEKYNKTVLAHNNTIRTYHKQIDQFQKKIKNDKTISSETVEQYNQLNQDI